MEQLLLIIEMNLRVFANQKNDLGFVKTPVIMKQKYILKTDPK